jgi:hypothetical protein
MSKYPTLDYDRESHEELRQSRDVIREASIEPVVDETDEFVHIPLRSVADSMGQRIEIGPYSLDEGDIVILHNILVAHIRTFPGSFQIKTGGAA